MVLEVFVTFSILISYVWSLFYRRDLGRPNQAKKYVCMSLEKKCTTFRFILILLNTAEDLLCIYRTVSKALYCCSVYCIFITFKKYTTMSRASISFYWLQHNFSSLKLSRGMWVRKGSQSHIHLCIKSILWDAVYPQATTFTWPLILSSRLQEHSTLTCKPVYEEALN